MSFHPVTTHSAIPLIPPQSFLASTPSEASRLRCPSAAPLRHASPFTAVGHALFFGRCGGMCPPPAPRPAAVSCYLCNPGRSLSAPSSLSLLGLPHPWQQQQQQSSATPSWQCSLDDKGMTEREREWGGALCLSGAVRVSEKKNEDVILRRVKMWCRIWRRVSQVMRPHLAAVNGAALFRLEPSYSLVPALLPFHNTRSSTCMIMHR